MQNDDVVPSLDDLNADIARHRVVKYLLATAIQMTPSQLSTILHGRAKLTPELAARIQRAILQPEVSKPR